MKPVVVRSSLVPDDGLVGALGEGGVATVSEALLHATEDVRANTRVTVA